MFATNPHVRMHCMWHQWKTPFFLSKWLNAACNVRKKRCRRSGVQDNHCKCMSNIYGVNFKSNVKLNISERDFIKILISNIFELLVNTHNDQYLVFQILLITDMIVNSNIDDRERRKIIIFSLPFYFFLLSFFIIAI